MYRKQGSIRCVAVFLAAVMIWINAPTHVAWAGLVTTEQTMADASVNHDRMRLTALLDRQDVQAGLEAHGIDPVEARARVASLTDAEVAQITAKLDELPAGGDGVGAVVGALLIVFLVLLFTDILGWTNVFPFVRR